MAAIPSTMMTDNQRLSFARVAAASASKDISTTTTTTIVESPGPAPPKEKRESTKTAAVSAPLVVTTNPAHEMSTPEPNIPPAAQKMASTNQSIDAKVVEGLKDLKLEATSSGPVVANGSLPGAVERSNRIGTSQTPSDDTSQRADSNSELGTKPPSLDGKSITSGTTFALDEKESLRPDDSASVKAAAEDDDAFSIRGSYKASSRMGSDVAARIHRIQIGDMPSRAATTNQGLVGNKNQGIITPQSGVSDKQLTSDAKLPLVSGAVAPDGMANGFLSQHPDEKLLEAMQSHKDRIFLLRLEQQVIEFVQDSKEPFMDLPPSNSFCRMLMHKLADYYHMTHSFESQAGAVRIFRTPFCRIPPSLSSIAASTPSSSSPAPVVMPRKIMRRGEDGEFGTSSAAPSKPTSEAGSDGKDKSAPSREKMTREEREEAYNLARQRIFGSSENKENQNQDGEDSNGVSRASSVSAKDRVNGGKRKVNKQRRDDNEGFESRSQFVAWCGPQQPTWASTGPQYYQVTTPGYNGQYQQQQPPQPVYQTTMQPMYGPGQPYPPQMVPANGYPPHYNAVPQTYQAPPVPQPRAPLQPQPNYQSPNGPPMAGPMYNTPVPAIQQPAWPQQPPPQAQPQPQPQPPPAFTQGAYPPPRGSPIPGHAGIPYAFGQLPVNVNPNDPKSQHPIPGSYSRQPFNPKTQSFVPGGGIPMQQQTPPPAGPYGGASSHHGSPHPQFNSPHLSYAGYQQPIPQPMPQPGYGPVPGAYSMTRQSSNASMTQYHNVPQPLHGVPTHGPQHMGGPPHMAPKSNGPPGPPGQQTYSHLPNYGNPATLPQKPST
ncbi:hypothetical protein QBC40DRAFT_68108 [Triangularia verruculosa]|uniref:Uncharacterized protein n=1 Tax=Triangularia verruculosa TaxID=2587418 RepID=A0AAN6XJC4_9PEZI|nr:hypothetical protein QBC40DRAFT_68108 [Triangularia verruculosa]